MAPNRLLTLVLVLFFSNAALSAQRSEGVAPGDLKWKVLFNFPECDHQTSHGKRPGAWCLIDDVRASSRSNGVEAQLEDWITDKKTKSLYLSFFSFSNKNIARALCKETSRRPELKVTIFLDKGESQVGRLEGNMFSIDADFSNPSSHRYDPEYKTGCVDRINPRATTRGSGGFGGPNNYLQHAKIFMALDQPSLPKSIEEMSQWISSANRVRFTSSSANMSSFGTTIHFENWIFFDAPASDFIAKQNVCTMMAFTQATGSNTEQRHQFKSFYQDCERSLTPNYRNDLRFYIVPSVANNNGSGPQQAIQKMLRRANEKVKVAIHRLTTSTVTRPLSAAARMGIPVEMIQDDDTLRTAVVNGGASFDVGGYDVKILRQNLRSGIDISFMETNSDPSGLTHMFHNKFIVVDDKVVFQGAGNFTSSALNAFGNDGNYEQFYVIRIPALARAYGEAWDYLRRTSTRRVEHEVGLNPMMCTGRTGSGMSKLFCDDPSAEDNFKIPGVRNATSN